MKKKIIFIILTTLVLLFAFFIFKTIYCPIQLGDLQTGDCVYVNNVKYDVAPKLNGTEDVKIVSIADNKTVLRNISDRYNVEFPGIFEFDFSKSKDYVIAQNESLHINISKDRSPYEDTFWYIDYYQNRFYKDENFLKSNNITLNEDRYEQINDKKTSVLTITKHFDNLPDVTYTYAFIQTNGQYYTRFMFKSNNIFDDNYIEMYTNILKSYVETSKSDIRETFIYYTNKVFRKFFNVDEFIANSTAQYFLDMHPIKDKNWDDKTLAFYDSFTNSEKLKWGIFTENITSTAIEDKIPNLEDSLDYKFDIILMYNHLGNHLPIEVMKKIKDEDRVIELTVQTCANNNTKLYDYTPMFDILEGKKDEQIKTLAKEIKEFGNPVLFRLNNEMNSDWTSYSGIITLSDPEIYKDVWKRIYGIFESENVTNCIWIFNPNDNNYPPSKWNNFLSYYPGNEYVHMIGITGYNTGTYYAKQNGEVWKSFKSIYDEIQSKYGVLFKDFPWIITEFASSSVGGNKAKWISEMFKNIHTYPNIKAAVWFSAADYDPAFKNSPTVARPYWLDETPETLNAFKNGLSNSK